MYALFIDNLMDTGCHWHPVSDYTEWFYHRVMAAAGSLYHENMASEHDALYAGRHPRPPEVNC